MTHSYIIIDGPVAFDLCDTNDSVESMNTVEEKEQQHADKKQQLEDLYAPVHRYLKPGKCDQ